MKKNISSFLVIYFLEDNFDDNLLNFYAFI